MLINEKSHLHQTNARALPQGGTVEIKQEITADQSLGGQERIPIHT